MGLLHVYGMIAAGCERMGRSSAYLSADHEMSMADLGSGHEERDVPVVEEQDVQVAEEQDVQVVEEQDVQVVEERDVQEIS